MLNEQIYDFAKKHGFSAYTELRSQKNSKRRIVLVNGSMVANDTSVTSGVSSRVYKNGAYGFASSPDMSFDGMNDVLKSALTNAEFLDSRQKLGIPNFPSVNGVNVPLDTEKDDVPQKVIADFLAETDNYIASKYPDLASRYVIANCSNMEKVLYTSDNSMSHSFTPMSNLYIVLAMTDKSGIPVDITEVFGGYGLFDDRYKSTRPIFDAIDKLYIQLRDKVEGVYPEGGEKQCILDSHLAGILAHEAVGHTVEADLVMSGSVGGPYLNKRVASDIVTLVDYANTAFGERCPVPVYVDDEGIKATDALLIENGILKGYMHNRESAAKYGVNPCGNARAYEFSDEPLIRMRNTAILPGKSKLEEMIASIDDGYYFIRTGNGQADLTGEFMFGVDFGYEIKNGKLGRGLRNSTISGIAFEMLQTVDMLSDEMVWDVGMCGKKQAIPVGMGGPAVKCRLTVGGR